MRSDPAQDPAEGAAVDERGDQIPVWILGLNAIPLLFNFSGTFFYVVIALLAMYLPARLYRAWQ
jgi:hypothetical protein